MPTYELDLSAHVRGVARATPGGCCPAQQIYALKTSSSKGVALTPQEGCCPSWDIYIYMYIYIYLVSVAPLADIYVSIYICLVSILYTATAPSFLLYFLRKNPYRPAYLPNFDGRSLAISEWRTRISTSLSAEFRRALPKKIQRCMYV